MIYNNYKELFIVYTRKYSFQTVMIEETSTVYKHGTAKIYRPREYYKYTDKTDTWSIFLVHSLHSLRDI